MNVTVNKFLPLFQQIVAKLLSSTSFMFNLYLIQSLDQNLISVVNLNYYLNDTLNMNLRTVIIINEVSYELNLITFEQKLNVP